MSRVRSLLASCGSRASHAPPSPCLAFPRLAARSQAVAATAARLRTSPSSSFRSTWLQQHRSYATSPAPTLPHPPPEPENEQSSPEDKPETLSTPAVARWLYATSFLTFSIIVVGGLTRLTESGLSITEWKPVSGMLPPIGDAEWEEEFRKYRESEEGTILNAKISIEDFKFIFFMEWAHRNLGRLIGVSFVLPAIYFAARGKLSRRDKVKVLALAGGIGFQGFLGWYMVASGLDAEHLSARPNTTPRVSQYRLAAHLGAALVLYVGMMHSAWSIIRDWKFAHGTVDVGPSLAQSVQKRNVFRRGVWGVAALVLLTAVSGAFVAGLDAGLIYNEFPQMGEGIVPPLPELYNPKAYARKADSSDGWWRNMLENPTTVQFDHRVLAVTTLLSLLTLTALSHSRFRPHLPRSTRRWASAASLVVLTQVTLGISTLLYLVPTPLAAAHQAGSVVLLTTMVGMIVSLRRQGSASRSVARMLAAKRGVPEVKPMGGMGGGQS